METARSSEVARKAKLIYESRLQSQLEAEHRDRYAAIEPESGDYFLGETMREAMDGARIAHPNRVSFVLRIGHQDLFHIGQVERAPREPEPLRASFGWLLFLGLVVAVTLLISLPIYAVLGLAIAVISMWQFGRHDPGTGFGVALLILMALIFCVICAGILTPLNIGGELRQNQPILARSHEICSSPPLTYHFG